MFTLMFLLAALCLVLGGFFVGFGLGMNVGFDKATKMFDELEVHYKSTIEKLELRLWRGYDVS